MLLENEGDGVEKDVASAISMHERTFDEGINDNVMNNLAMLLQTGSNRVETDAPRTVSQVNVC